jgi:hypothetical protein
MPYNKEHADNEQGAFREGDTTPHINATKRTKLQRTASTGIFIGYALTER